MSKKLKILIIRRRPAQLHEGRADHQAHPPESGHQRRRSRISPRSHRPALRREDVGRVFRRTRHSRADINFGVGSGSHAVQMANVMTKFETVCEKEKPDWILVVGDVNSTMACTLVGAKLNIKVAHGEAGLCSHDRTMREEVNRLVTDALADLLLRPSHDGDENLKREGVPDSKIKLVGNVMIDALIANHPGFRMTCWNEAIE